jgi:hypothetical protein
MAGMRVLALCIASRAAYCNSAVGGACRISQMASAKSAVVPLWKVIVGPQPANCSRARKGPAFSFADHGRSKSTAEEYGFRIGAEASATVLLPPARSCSLDRQGPC